MKFTKRMQNAVIQGNILNIVFLCIMLGGIIFFSLPRIQDIAEKKQEILQVYQDMGDIQKSGMSYGEFRKEIGKQGLSKDVYIKTLLQDIDNRFYTKNFTNTGSENYEVFLQGVEKYIESLKDSEEYIQKDSTLAKILPSYSKNNSFSQEGLSDFYFINYIEKLIYSFNLQAEGEIGIGEIQSVNQEDIQKDDKKTIGLEEKIFKIPLYFKVTGQKSNVVDFLHFFEYVGAISVEGEDLSIYQDNFIKKSIEGDTYTANYNIYENQFADIENIVFSNYPDSSPTSTGKKGLISLMKTEQSRDKMLVELDLNFYVAGIPGYKMEKYVQSILDTYTKLSADISRDARKYTLEIYKFSNGKQLQSVQALQSLDILLLALDEDMKKFRGEFAQKKNIQNTFERAAKYNKQLEAIQTRYELYIESLLGNNTK